ncbi:Geranylgeranyl pyrophosphate synthase chloroplastic [Euphorbia peplus]|nr:Geranylgeranyl pyrophosphate synthase chloroplastic [Euphorbia peplus]
MAAGSLSSFYYNPLSTVVKPSNNSHRRKPLLITSMAMDSHTSSYWASINIEIDTHLNKAIPIKPPLVVSEPMRHFTFAAPKTSAPALCIAACELFGGSREQALAAATALRLMQAATSTRENIIKIDLQNKIDNFEPAFGYRYGPNLELLTPDAMVPLGFELLARVDDPDHIDPGRIVRVIMEISHAMGSKGMIEGQYNEIKHVKSECRDGSFDGMWLNDVCRKKEGRIHACAGACGAILGGGNEEEIEKMRRCGVYAGMIQGILKKGEEKGTEEWHLREVNELRELAFNELKDFNQDNVGGILSVLDNKFCDV